MSKLARIRQSLARWIAGSGTPGRRMYHSAKSSRLTMGWGASNGSADGEIGTSLAVLRSRSRALMRDASYAKRARDIVVNNVVGTGIGMQAQVVSTRGTAFERINEAIEEAWCQWTKAANCHTGGGLHFHDIERMAMAQVFEAGEVFIRLHRTKFGDSKVPLALELVEAERIADDYSVPMASTGNPVRLGIEVDAFQRPIAYWLRTAHLSDAVNSAGNQLLRVPAADMIHLRIVDRWPQTRGVPWLHTSMRRLNDMDGYSEAEIIAARTSSCVVGFIQSPELPVDPGAGDGANGMPREMAMEPGMIEHLAPGESFTGFSPQRPNSGMDAFMRLMLREVAAGAGVSYESLSRDYSQSNYSSSRLSLLDDRDTWRVLQAWFIRNLRAPLHSQWLQQAVMAGAVAGVDKTEYASNREKFEAVTWKPRGWTWVDPTKEVDAYVKAIRAGLTTITDVVAATAGGADVEDVITKRKRELKLFEDAGIELDTTVVDTADTTPVDEAGMAQPAPGRVHPIARAA